MLRQQLYRSIDYCSRYDVRRKLAVSSDIYSFEMHFIFSFYKFYKQSFLCLFYYSFVFVCLYAMNIESKIISIFFKM